VTGKTLDRIYRIYVLNRFDVRLLGLEENSFGAKLSTPAWERALPGFVVTGAEAALFMAGASGTGQAEFLT
jgi:hypothetical protein